MDTTSDIRDAPDTDDPSRFLCAAYGCPLLGTVKRGEQWLCDCHADYEPGRNDEVTRVIRRYKAIWTVVLDIHAWHGCDDWPRMYASMRQRLIEAQRPDLLPGEADASPYRPGKPVLQQWLARLERQLTDSVQHELSRSRPDATHPKSMPSSTECVARMRTILAPLGHTRPSPTWAFELIAGAHPVAPEARREAIAVMQSRVGRAFWANLSSAQRTRYRAAYENALDSLGAALPSREPGEDDEEPSETPA